MEPFPLFEDCKDGPCPKVLRLGDGLVAVQGDMSRDRVLLARSRPSAAEGVVLIPEEVLIEAALALRALLDESP